jgi:5-methylthioadenosine/S-adenosylhomocysteine deaminase
MRKSIEREADFLIRNVIVLPLEGRRRYFEDGSVLVLGGLIRAVGDVATVDAHPAVAHVPVIDGAGHVLLPGFHNCHLHSGLLRGTAESMALWEWLQVHVDPAHRALTPEIAEAASYMAYAESLRSGTVSVLDMWRFMERAAKAAEKVGIRATLAPYTADRYDYFESLDSNRRLLDAIPKAVHGRVRAWVGLEHMFYCSPEMYRAAAALAEEFDTGIHTHASETKWEVEECLRQYGRRPIEVFQGLGILGNKTVLAHGVWLNDREVQILVQTGTAIAHCPCSNMKLASGIAPIRSYRERGLTVALGTDGEKENNNLDMLEEMKFASLLAKVSALDPTAGDPWDVLAMATLEGARALGLEDISGSIEEGKAADLVMIDLRSLHFVPTLTGDDFNLPAHLVFSATGNDVSDVWVAGRRLVEDGVVRSVDVAVVARQAQLAAEELFERRRHLDGGIPSTTTDRFIS